MNKAGYTATQVACGWAGAIFELTRALGQEQYGQRIKNIKKVKCDRPTDKRTDKAGCRVACMRLKNECYVFFQPTGALLWNALDEALVAIEQFNSKDFGSTQKIEDDVSDDGDDDE